MSSYFRFELLRRPSDELEMMLRSPVTEDDEDDGYYWDYERRLSSDDRVLEALARHMKLPYAATDNTLFVRMAQELLDLLELMFTQPNNRTLGKRLREVPPESLKGSTLPQLLDLYTDLKWRGTVIEDGTTLITLAAYLRRIAAENLADRADELMKRWKSQGMQALAERHRPTVAPTPSPPPSGAPRKPIDLRRHRSDNPLPDYSPPSTPDASKG